MSRPAWTDIRLDDLNHKVDRIDKRVDDLAHRMDARFEAQQQHMDARFNAVDARFDALQRTLIQAAVGMAATFVTGFAALAGLIATHL